MGLIVHIQTQTLIDTDIIKDVLHEFGITLCFGNQHPSEDFFRIKETGSAWELQGFMHSLEMIQLLLDQLEVYSKGILAEVKGENLWQVLLPNHSYEFRPGLNQATH